MRDAVQQIKERLDIVDVISSYTKLEKSGVNWKARCPFHNEKSPSFFVSSTRQSFYCFGCGEKGDIFSFVEKFEGLDFKGALKSLADRAGVDLKETKINKESVEEKDKLLQIMEEATKIYEDELAENKEAKKYIENRGLTETSVSKWRLGLAKDEWRKLHDFLTERGFSRSDLLLAGLIKKVEGEEKYYDTFRGRIMFPICDSAGRVIAFSGRALKDDPKAPKYLNSPETSLFYKSETLYGLHIAKNYIRKQDYTVLVEGQMDLCMSHQAGVMNTVASSGTALTELHLKKIQKLSNRVIIAYDGDEAGEKAAMRASALVLSLGMEAKIASLKDGEDPASVIKNNPEDWKNTLKESVHVIDYALQKALQKKESGVAKAVLQEVLPLVSLLKSEIEKARFVKKIATKIGVGEEAVWSDMKKIVAAAKSMENEVDNVQAKKEETANLEKILVGIIFTLESKNLDGSNLQDLIDKWQGIVGKEEVESILSKYAENKEAFIFETENHGMEKDAETIFADLLRRIELKKLKEDLQKTAILLDGQINSEEDEKSIKQDIDKIQGRIKQLET